MWENTYNALKEYGLRLRDEYRKNLQSNDRRATGDLINSIEVDVEQNGREFTVYLTLADYWKYVEYDTSPHFPPLDAIKKWISAKPILPEERNGHLPTPDQLAFLIGRAMAGLSPNQARCKNPQGGTTGTHDLTDAQDKVLREFFDAIAQAVLDDAAGDIGAVMVDFFPKVE